MDSLNQNKAANLVGLRRAEKVDIKSLCKIQQRAVLALNKSTVQLYATRDWEKLFKNPEVFTYVTEDKEPFGFVTVGEPQ